MSGGHFEYNQWRIDSISNELKELIEKNYSKEKEDDDCEWGGFKGRHYSKATIKEFQKAWKILNLAYIYTQRIDWLVSGDDSEDCFERRLKDDLEELKKKKVPAPFDKP
jgi:hypothetical protein